MRSRTLVLVVSASMALLAIAVAFAAKAGPGLLDKSFGGDGRGELIVTSLSSGFRDVEVDSKGRTLAIGDFDAGVHSDFLVARYTPSGRLDDSFAGDGVFTLDGHGIGEGDQGFGLVIDSKDRVIGTGASGDGDSLEFAAFRLKPSGALDQTFSDGDGTNGLFSVDINSDDLPDRAAEGVIDSDGRIVLAGHTTIAGGFNADFAVVRLLADGTPDDSFDGNGIQATSIPGVGDTNDRAVDVAIDSQGRIVLGGFRGDGPAADDFAAVRYTPEDGDEDVAFGSNGATAFDFAPGYSDAASAVSIAFGDKVVLAGGAGTGTGSTLFALARLDDHGNPDNSFDGDARVVVGFPPGVYSEAFAMTSDSHGHLILGGPVDLTDDGDPFTAFGLARLSPSGKLDQSFGTGGRATFDFGPESDSSLNALAVEPRSGRIIAAGAAEVSGVDNLAVARVGGEPLCFGKAPTITGSEGGDRLVGTRKPDVIYGGNGNDKLLGKGGKDRLCGGKGRDRIRGGPGKDREKP